MVIRLDKGDILGMLFVSLPTLAGLMVLATVVFYVMAGDRPKGWAWLPILAVFGILALTGWALWEAAHWLAG